jgi:hypothetical protein
MSASEVVIVQGRLDRPLFDRLENWRRRQRTIPSRSDVVRQSLIRMLGAADPDNALAEAGQRHTGREENYHEPG